MQILVHLCHLTMKMVKEHCFLIQLKYLIFIGFQFGERFILYYTTHLLLSIFNIHSPEELAAEDDRNDKTGFELLNEKRLIETMDRAYNKLKEANGIVLYLTELTPSYHAYKDLLA